MRAIGDGCRTRLVGDAAFEETVPVVGEGSKSSTRRKTPLRDNRHPHKAPSTSNADSFPRIHAAET